ncbi:MAG: hypothetical protein B6244_07930 [Candidatus Cloacimonetes bacterium 4572_55]|nr:MAG: hypothetical protein B6244_07930 [Candidatus Cloacimonetes bacterium 4572_55]
MRFVTRFYFFGIIFITVLFISIHAQATVIYVDESVTGTGSSWAAAYGDLQPALSAASSGDSIWVAQGVYKPTATSTNRTATFQLINGVALFGGFPTGGGDGTFSARDVSAYSTILSGDIDSNDSQTPSITDLSTVTGNTTNSLHVVTGSNTDTSALLDGFTVTAGCANSDGSDGGGMYNVIGSPTIRSCTFRGNHAEDEGGGMYNYRESSPIISDCLFADNYAGDNGGGMENRRDSHAVITNCIFSYNRSADHGAGMYNDSQQGACNPSITHCRFDHNSTEGGFGGGLCNRYPGVAVIDNCTFEYNTANGSNAEALGGGMQNDNGASPIVRNCDFTNNSARYGGGMYNRGLGIPCNITISHCLFQGNSTTDYGGGLMFRHDAHGSVSHCVISGDSTSGDGGGFVCGTDSNVLMSHCTITGNYAGGDGENGGIYNFDNSSVTVNNCIVWDNNGTQIYSDVADSVTVNYSTVMGGWSGPGGDNQTTTPLFVTDINSSDAPTVDGNFHLQSGSPAIDVGSNSLIPPDSANVDSNPDPGAPVEIDLDGNARIFSATVDMGPYEYFGNSAPYVADPMGSVKKSGNFSYFGYDLTSVFNDIDGDLLSFSFASPTDTTIVRAFFRNDSLIILSRPNLTGKDSVYVQADDGNGETVIDSLKITVSDVNDDPTVAIPMSSVNKPEDFSYFGYDLTSVFNDTDGDPLSFSFVSPTDTTIVRAFFRNDSLIIHSRPNQSGKDSVYVQADDGNGGMT